MTLTWPIVAAVLFGALLHAAWNALIKAGSDKQLDTALMHVLGCVITLPLVAVIGLPDPAAWPWIAASAMLHVGYYTALAGAYRHGDLGLTYPIMRGLAPLLVALASSTLLGEALPLATWLGVAGISAGVLMVGLSRGAAAGTGSHGHAVRWALLNAAIIAAYTVVDGNGVRAGGSALQYVATLVLVNGLPYFTLVMWRRGAGRSAAWAYMARRWKLALLGMLASAGSYAIALWAMTQAPVAAVAALRETSVLFAALIGSRWLKESFGLRRAAGTALIVGGVVTLRLL
ncbi:DMT family transporter [Piscinibacter sp. XHJ-5]|uniref:DMT family transporter n=1 Tax=Piscinibacter sp. XHJ-5 TaxID=3037797 RepID=UPI00245368BF|nr:DMT family transporter [Piscinibacter sp. XHJ-5]